MSRYPQKFTGPSNETDQQPCSSSKSRRNELSQTMKMFGGVITVRQDVWVKMMMAKGGLSVTSIVKSTIFRVLALIMQKINIMILILKTRCFFFKECE